MLRIRCIGVYTGRKQRLQFSIYREVEADEDGKILHLLAEEQKFDQRHDPLSAMIEQYKPAEDELDMDELELLAAAGTGLSFEEMQKLRENKEKS